MKDLHIALLVLAAVLLIALYAYSKWQERQALKRFQNTLQAEVGDALLQPPSSAQSPAQSPGHAAPRRSSSLQPNLQPNLRPPSPPGMQSGEPAGQAPGMARFEQRIEPHLEFAGAGADHDDDAPGSADDHGPAAGSLPAAGIAADWVEDADLDCVLELRCAHPVDGVAIFDAAAALGRLDVALPVFVVAWDGRDQQWESPDRFGFYSELLVAVQLARRDARLDAISASRFIAAVQQVALALDADFDTPDVDRLVAQATELDRRCAQFDVKIGLTVESRSGPWDAQRLAIAMAACEFVPVEAARWERRQRVDAIDAPFLAVKFDSLLADRLALELDVPAAPAAGKPLLALLAAAEQMSAALDARLVDDNGRPIDAASVAAIEQQLTEMYAQMRAAGLEPGSRRALRLYA